MTPKLMERIHEMCSQIDFRFKCCLNTLREFPVRAQYYKVLPLTPKSTGQSAIEP